MVFILLSFLQIRPRKFRAYRRLCERSCLAESLAVSVGNDLDSIFSKFSKTDMIRIDTNFFNKANSQ